MLKIAFVFPLFVTLACQPQKKEAALEVDENGEVSGTLPDGTEVRGEEEYETGLASQIGPIEEMQPLALTVSAKGTDGGARGLTVGKFRITVQPDMSYLDGCIRRSFLHLKAVIENADLPAAMAELHLVAWFESGKPCFAVMNTGFIGYGWCYKLCVENPKTALKNGIKGGLIAAGVGTGIAAIIAAVTAPVATVALAI